MALIGTISGSNRTSTTAISGSLIIADEPGSRFPALAGGVKLFVSGAKTQLGSDSPMAVFGGDTFVSGAFGTDSYIQMKPVGALRVPTNTTASYIYTSGSTNDLYFTQYQPGTGYTNTTRLRWIESTLQTGLQYGGVLSSTSGSTTYNISSGSGLIITQNASLTDDPYPTIVHVEWGNLSSLPLPSLGTTQITYVAMDSTGTPYLKSTPFLDGDFENYIVLGRVLHTDKVGTNGAVNQPAVAYGASQFRGDFVRAFGPIKISGHTFYVSGTTGLKKDAGDSYAEGRNYTTNPNSPNYVLSTTDTAQNTSKIFYEYVNAAGDDVILNNGNLGYSAVDFAQYNNAGTLATVGSGNKFTIQRVYWFPNAVNRSFYVYYGNTIYSTIADAQAGIFTEIFTEGKNTRDSAIFLGYLIVKGTLVDFTDPTTYKVVQAGSFRAVASSGAGSSGAPGGSNTYVQFNDAGVFNGTSEFRFEKTTATALLAKLVVSGTSEGSLVTSGTLQVKDSSGNVVSSISSVGAITGSRITSNAAGSLVNGNGQIYLNGVSSNRIDFSTQGTGDPAFNAPTAGTKVVLYPAAGASATDYALGISPATLWQSIPAADAGMMFKWFGGTTTLAALSGSGNMQLSGDLAVNGGDITSTAAGLNISAGSSGLSFQLVGSSFATFASGANGPIQQATLQASLGKSLVLAAGLGSTAPTPQVTISGSYVEIRSGRSGTPSGVDFSTDVAGLPQSYLNISSGSYTAGLGTATNVAKIAPSDLPVPHDLLLGASATRNLFLSGTTVAANAGSFGFAFQRDGVTVGLAQGVSGSSFTIGSGPGLVSLNLVSSGNVTVRLDSDNNASGHTFEVQDHTGSIRFKVSEDNFVEVGGTLNVTGSTTLSTTIERVLPSNGGTGVVAFDTSLLGIFYVNSPAGDITANFTNVPVTNNRILTPTVILSQSATPRIVSAVQIDTSPQTINWANGTTPAGTAGKQDVFGFSLIRSGSAWKVLGQMSTYG